MGDDAPTVFAGSSEVEELSSDVLDNSGYEEHFSNLIDFKDELSDFMDEFMGNYGQVFQDHPEIRFELLSMMQEHRDLLSDYEHSLRMYHLSMEQEIKSLKQQNEALKEQANYDYLTGLLNRKVFDVELNKAVDDVREDPSEDVHLMMVDIDGFKEFNDEYGHKRGDEMLRTISNIISSNLCDGSKGYRYGGDEFGVISRKSLEKTKDCAEGIREAIDESDLSETGITVSIGITPLDGSAESPSYFVERADEALYEVKDNGKNDIFVKE